MRTFPEYESFDALGLADLVRRREVTPLELVDAAIDRIEHRNARLNAVIQRDYERARRAATEDLPEGPFRGVPFLLKDLLTARTGDPLGSGSRFFDGWRAAGSTEYVRRMERTGLVVVGRTNTPELGLVPVTEPAAFGPTRNPWDAERTPGGSSGGSAAAIAAGMVPFASGGDGGGSIRIPASCCGLFGLKPSRGRNPTGPYDGERWEGFAVEHVLTRSVRDSAAMLDATAGPDTGAPYWLPGPPRPFREEARTAPGRLRVVVTTEPLLTATVHEDCREAVRRAADLLRELGHEIVEAGPSIDGRAFKGAMSAMLAGQVAADLRDAAELTGRKPSLGAFEAMTWMTGVLGETFTAGEYQFAVRRLQRISRELCAFTDKFDVWLTPTLGHPPPRIGELLPSGVLRTAQSVIARLGLGRTVKALGLVDGVAEPVYRFVPYTPLQNATGQPAMSVPLHWNSEGLPIGVMFTAKYGDEATLFRLAGQLEAARPWKDRRPPVE